MKQWLKENHKKFFMLSVIFIFILTAIATTIWLTISKKSAKLSSITPELAKAMTYPQVQEGEESVEGNEYVKFDAFFLRDINNDGYTEGIRGTSKEIGKEDTLYMELNVQTAGYLKDAKITINGENFYLQTALPKDEQLQDNYIGNNIKEIKFNQINNGTQKLLTGIVRSGDYSYASQKTAAIGNNINNYSKTNNVTLTGTYVGEDGTETAITKKVDLQVDWYGTVGAQISHKNQEKDISKITDEANNEINLEFDIETEEPQNQLILKKSYIEGEIPELNGYAPTKVEVTGTNVNYTYDETTRKFTAQREAIVDENGNITRNTYSKTSNSNKCNEYKLKVTYPIEAYQSLGADTIELKIPVATYYEGYNNQNREFKNPYKSNTAKDTIIITFKKPQGTIAIFEVTVGKYVYDPTGRYIISKEKPTKIYNEISAEEKDDIYLVRWTGSTGTDGQTTGMTMKETKTGGTQITDQFIKNDTTTISMEEITSNIGIYFTNPVSLLGDNGWIKVYDDQTGNLIETFTKENWNKYTANNPYTYKTPVKHVRIETSETSANNSLTVYHVKKLDDTYITEHFTKQEFDNLKYIKSTLAGYLGGSYINQDTHQADYEAPFSIATVTVSKTAISTQETEKNLKVTINAKGDNNSNQVKWINGAFILKMSKDMVDIEINNVSINNSSVKIASYEIYEEDGNNYIKIITENQTEAIYSITIDCNVTPDPRIPTTTETIELYASNENTVEYYETSPDIFDVNGNLNTTEKINKATVDISLISPNSLLTSQIASNYDETEKITIAPKIANVSKEQRTAKVNIEINNNYTNKISEVQILGRVPYEGNKYTINGSEMGSTFTTTMSNRGITLPEVLQRVAKIYYSEKGEATKDLKNTSNGWTQTPADFSKVKSYLIDLGNYELQKGEKHTLSYEINIPEGISYNQISYSHHAVYFSLETSEGKYKTKTEPNKVGFMIAKQYDLELTKFQKSKTKLVAGATYSIKEESQEDSKTKVTGEDGKLTLTGLYVDKTYIVKEIKSPTEYELNPEEIKFKVTEENGKIQVTKISGTTKMITAIQAQGEQNYKVKIEVEDESKASLKITKKEQGTENKIQKVSYKITGNGLPEKGKTIITNINGEINLKGLTINSEYTLKEIKAEGYYLAEPIKFKITNNDGTYETHILEGIVKEHSATEENSIPTINMVLEDEKIPTYDLQIIKIKKTAESTLSSDSLMAKVETSLSNTEVSYLEGAKFRLYKGTEEIGEYITDSTGKIAISGLYQYETAKNIDQTYTLKEVLAPEGYAKVKDITFKVENKEGSLQLIEDLQDGQTAKSYTSEGNTVKLTIEDSPSFKLIKKDQETKRPIANVKFAIYNEENGKPATNSKGEILGTQEIINGKEYYTIATNSNGEITADLTEGLYKAVEVQAPEQYDITNATYYFGIGTSQEGRKTIEAELAKTIGGSSSDYIKALTPTTDGGYIAGGSFQSSIIELGNGESLSNKGSSDGMIIKYTAEGEIEWTKSIGGSKSDYIYSVIETNDGGFIVGGAFSSSSIDLGNGISLSNTSLFGYTNGMIIKYSSSGEIEWSKAITDSFSVCIYSVAQTEDGGFIAGGFNGLNGSNDGIIIKYSSSGEVEWTKEIGGSKSDRINSITPTEDGGFIVGGYFESDSIDLGNGKTLTNNNPNIATEGMIIKYNSTGEVEWAKTIGGSKSDRINSITQTEDGGFIAGGYFQSSIIDLGNGKSLSNNGNSDGIIIKYSSSGEIEWAKAIGGIYNESINSITPTEDGGFIAGGEFESRLIDLSNGKSLNNNGSFDGMIIKYNSSGEVEWARGLGGDSSDVINSVNTTRDGRILAGGSLGSSSVNLGNGEILNNNGSSDGMIIKYKQVEVPEITIKKAQGVGGNDDDKITTISPTKDGGYIAGGYFESSSIDLENGESLSNKSDSTIYSDGMIIKYNNSGKVEWAKGFGGSNSDYINSVVQTEDGGYLAVGYILSDNIDLGNGETLINNDSSDGIIIKYTSEGEIQWAKKIQLNNSDEITSIATTSDGGYIVGGCFSSSSIDLGNGEILSNNGDLDGMIIKYNSSGEVEWAKTVGEGNTDRITSVSTTNDGGYIAGGYFSSSSIDLGNGKSLSNNGSFDGMIIKYSSSGELEWAKGFGGSSDDCINSVVSTEDEGYIVGGDFGSFDFNLENGEVLNNNGNSDGMIIKYSSSGKVEWAKVFGGENNELISCIAQTTDGKYIAGGQFLSSNINLGNGEILNNNGASDGMILTIKAQMGAPEIQELVVENNLKQFKVTTDIKEIDGTKGGTISGEDQKAYEKVQYGKNSTKEIIMRPDENYEIIGITVNGKEYPFTANADGTYTMPQFTNMVEDKHIVVTYSLKDNKITINKVDSKTKTPLEGAIFKLNQIETSSEPYQVEITTNSEGKAITQIPFGKYQITEIKAPEGYEQNNTPTEIEFKADGSHEFTIENTKKAKVTVYHYIKGTTTKVAEDSLLEGKINENYITTPHLDLEKYELEKSTSGLYVLPSNATGTYQETEQTVIYYYVEKQIPLTVHHYIEGTTTKVPLQDGTDAQDVTDKGEEGTTYTTTPISETVLSEKYELVETPSNATGTYTGNEIEVTYYYKKVQRKMVLTKYQEDGTTPLEGARFTIKIKGSTTPILETETNNQGKIETILEAGIYEVTEIQAPEGYQLPENATTEVTINKNTDIATINLNNSKKQGKVLVHHYIYDAETNTYTTTKVPSTTSGQVVQDEIKTGNIGDTYATKQAENKQPNYEFTEVTGSTSGTYTEETQEVIYYYKIKTPEILEPTITKTSTTETAKNILQSIDYKITYKTTIKNYIGNGTITIVDELPYEIDEAKSNTAGGTYSKADKTITWTENLTNIDTFANGTKQVEITKDIELVYTNINTRLGKITNTSKGTLHLDTPDTTKENQTTKEIPTDYLTNVTINKTWNHTNNIYQIPTQVKIKLKNGSNIAAEKVINESNKTVEDENIWTWTFNNLPKYDIAGQEITYTVAEEEVTAGDLAYYKSTTSGLNITNTYNGPIISQTKEMTTERNRQYVIEGEKITYTIKAINSGSLGKDIIIKDQIPTGTTFVEGSIVINGTPAPTKTAQDLTTTGIKEHIAGKTNTENGTLTIKFSVTVNNAATGDITNAAMVDENNTNETKIPILTFEKTATVTKAQPRSSTEENEVTLGDNIYYQITVRNTGSTNIQNIEIKDTIPEGTKIKDPTSITGSDLKWTIDEILAGEQKQVGFTVDVVYLNSNKHSIRNVATINGDKTNETDNPYISLEPTLESKVEKTGTDKITTKDGKVYYEIKFTSKINNFVGNAKVQMIDKLPFPINTENSTLNEGTYNAENNTITWEETIQNINTATNGEKQITITKVLELSYNYGNLDNTSGTMLNTVNTKIELYRPQEDDPSTQEKIKEDVKQAQKETKIEIPAKVIVHHYIYDEETQKYTTVKLTEDEIIGGIVGEEYNTTPSNKVAKNYECINSTPDKHEGKMKEETTEVIYYYKLMTPVVENTIKKDVQIITENTDTINTTHVLRKEDGIVTYNIHYNTTISNYIGKAKIQIVDTLPAKIDKEKSNLNGGNYNEQEQTITWTEEINNIDTYANGVFNKQITKQINLVYKDQNVFEDLNNTATGIVKTYYPQTHSTNPSRKYITKEATDDATIKQDYKVDLKVTKQWEDNENKKQQRPESVIVEIKQVAVKQETTGEETLETKATTEVELNEANNWTYEKKGLPKYDSMAGTEIKYQITEKEKQAGDLEYYDTPQIIFQQTQTDQITDKKYTITNKYKLKNTDLNTQITKKGTDEITSSQQKVDYQIKFTGEIKEYIGEGNIKIVDTLPFKIDEEKSILDGGKYDDENQTITWKEELPHINTDTAGQSHHVEVIKNITLIYKNLDPTINVMTNKVTGRIELYETEAKDEKESTYDTKININGKVKVRYVDKDSGKDIIRQEQVEEPTEEKTYNYKIEDKVGKKYQTQKKEIENYIYIESTNNEEGLIKEEDQEVIYYYTRIDTKVIVKYVDKEGKELAEEEIINGKIWDPYTTTQKDIENYQLIRVTDNQKGTMTKDTIEVIYIYDKIPTKVIVKYLEKDNTPEDNTDNKILAPEDTLDGYEGEDYKTNRKAITNYRAAEPKPENAEGKMTKDTITVIYYYEKIPSGILNVKYVDKDTNEEIIYQEKTNGTTQEKTYGYKIQGAVGDTYKTEEKQIPYYKLVEKTDNTQGTLTENNDSVIYYYRKLAFNLQIDKWVSNMEVNGKTKNGKTINTKDQISKIDIYRKAIETTNIKITYKIRITNTGEIEGTAREIQENIPEGFSFYPEDNSTIWKNKNGTITTNYLEQETIKPGEYKEIEIVLRWNKGAQNFGTKENRAIITKTNNPAGYEESQKEDNQAKSDVIISIATGLEIGIKITVIIGLLCTLIGFSILIIKKLKESKNTDKIQ